jgi:hypothetical protein
LRSWNRRKVITLDHLLPSIRDGFAVERYVPAKLLLARRLWAKSVRTPLLGRPCLRLHAEPRASCSASRRRPDAPRSLARSTARNSASGPLRVGRASLGMIQAAPCIRSPGSRLRLSSRASAARCRRKRHDLVLRKRPGFWSDHVCCTSQKERASAGAFARWAPPRRNRLEDLIERRHGFIGRSCKRRSATRPHS